MLSLTQVQGEFKQVRFSILLLELCKDLRSINVQRQERQRRMDAAEDFLPAKSLCFWTILSLQGMIPFQSFYHRKHPKQSFGIQFWTIFQDMFHRIFGNFDPAADKKVHCLQNNNPFAISTARPLFVLCSSNIRRCQLLYIVLLVCLCHTIRTNTLPYSQTTTLTLGRLNR